MSMKPDIKQRWINALRSGNYDQARLSLRDGDNFCCLGVLCDLYGKEKDVLWIFEDFEESESPTNEYLCAFDGGLPDNVMAWAGLEYDYEANPVLEIRADGTEIHATTANDTYRYDFAKIADLIEARSDL